MAIIDADLEILPGPSSKSGKPKNLITGPRRKIAKAARAKLMTLLKADEREGSRAARLEYTPLFVTGGPASDEHTDVLNVIARLTDALLAKG